MTCISKSFLLCAAAAIHYSLPNEKRKKKTKQTYSPISIRLISAMMVSPNVESSTRALVKINPLVSLDRGFSVKSGSSFLFLFFCRGACLLLIPFFFLKSPFPLFLPVISTFFFFSHSSRKVEELSKRKKNTGGTEQLDLVAHSA